MKINELFQGISPWLQPFWFVLFLSLVLTLVGLGEVDEVTLQFVSWLISLSIGTLAHNGINLFWLKRGWLPAKKSLAGLLPMMSAGAGLTVLCLLPFFLSQLHRWQEGVGQVFSILAVCLLIQALIYPTKIYDHLLELAERQRKERLLSSGEVIEVKEGEEIQLIPLVALSAILVKDHYLHFIHQRGGEWSESLIFGRLKDWEEKLPHLIRLNRSSLVNPLHSIECKEEKATAQVWQAGLEQPLNVTTSCLGELDRLPQDLRKA